MRAALLVAAVVALLAGASAQSPPPPPPPVPVSYAGVKLEVALTATFTSATISQTAASIAALDVLVRAALVSPATTSALSATGAANVPYFTTSYAAVGTTQLVATVVVTYPTPNTAAINAAAALQSSLALAPASIFVPVYFAAYGGTPVLTLNAVYGIAPPPPPGPLYSWEYQTAIIIGVGLGGAVVIGLLTWAAVAFFCHKGAVKSELLYKVEGDARGTRSHPVPMLDPTDTPFAYADYDYRRNPAPSLAVLPPPGPGAFPDPHMLPPAPGSRPYESAMAGVPGMAYLSDRAARPY